MTSSNIRRILKTLVQEPDSFTPQNSFAAMTEIMEGNASPAQIATFLTALKLHKLDHNPEIVATCANVMRDHALQVPLDEMLSKSVVDIVGTGGDGQDTFNCSTAAGIVAAAAGCYVAKHGNRASSSKSGAADLLEKCGCQVANIKPTEVSRILQEHHYCFLFSQTYHPAMRHVAVPRREMGVPTIFNLLGPMSNPVRPRRMVVGVYSPEIGRLMVEALKCVGTERALVVCGAEGLDEISIAGETHVWSLEADGEITEFRVHPTRDFGLPVHPLEKVRGGLPEENARLLEQILAGEYTGPVLDFVLMNASAVLVVAGEAKDFLEGVEKCRAALRESKGRVILEGFRRESIHHTNGYE
ncbi:uncharacterized protein VTP21DRAFT_9790 [Calcarisporiella thermophila]|uniref:uncharacterized protein n=1 Tax=Calcarisporiella thermophila TaxID=911321 RepID=UPI003743966C